MDVNAYGCAKMRTDHFYPENHNSVRLECQRWGDSVTFYGLPYEKAKALALLFADAGTTVHFNGAVPSKPYLENVAAVDAMVANDAAVAAVKAEAEAAANPIEMEF